MELVEIRGPGGLAKVAAKDAKAYLRRSGYSLAGTPSTPKRLSDADRADAARVAAGAKVVMVEKASAKPKVKTDEKTAADLAEAAKQDAAGFKELLATVKKANTPELELIVDEYDLRLTLSRINLVADRRIAVAKALQAKMEKG